MAIKLFIAVIINNFFRFSNGFFGVNGRKVFEIRLKPFVGVKNCWVIRKKGKTWEIA
jgi:hypothetical protein